jgi:hypothetical protein
VPSAAALSQAVPSYQTNGRVTSIATVGNTVYIGGDFTAVRPPGAAPGSAQVPRDHLAAFRADTGKLRRWAPTTNGTVSALAAGPSGRTLFVGGDFSTLNGKVRHHLGAVSTKTGATTRFKAGTNGEVRALLVTRSRVYLGGSFTEVKGKHRLRLAATTRKGRLVARWKPHANRNVLSLALSANGRAVYVGGYFTFVNGHADAHLTALSPVTGRIKAWKAHPRYGVWDIVVRKRRVYVGGDGTGGRIQAFTRRGHRVWAVQTDGGVQGLTLFHGAVIAGGHFAHVCVGNTSGPVGGFTCPEVLANRSHLLALGHRSGTLKAWNPSADSALGVFALTTGTDGFYAGGDFTHVSGLAQQGFARFPKS